MDRRAFDRGPDGRSTDIDSGGGVPRGSPSSLNYCTHCGGALHFGEVDGEDRHRLACAVVRPHRLRQPAPRRDDVPDHRRRRGRPPPPRHRARLGLVGPARRLPRGRRDGPPGGDPRDAGGDRPVVEPGEIIGLYTRLEAAVVDDRVRGADRRRRPPRRPRGARDRGLRARGDPVAGSRSRRPAGRCATGSPAPARTSTPASATGTARSPAQSSTTGRLGAAELARGAPVVTRRRGTRRGSRRGGIASPPAASTDATLETSPGRRSGRRTCPRAGPTGRDASVHEGAAAVVACGRRSVDAVAAPAIASAHRPPASTTTHEHRGRRDQLPTRHDRTRRRRGLDRRRRTASSSARGR